MRPRTLLEQININENNLIFSKKDIFLYNKKNYELKGKIIATKRKIAAMTQ